MPYHPNNGSSSSTSSSPQYQLPLVPSRPPQYQDEIYRELQVYYRVGNRHYIFNRLGPPVSIILPHAPERIPQEGISQRMKDFLAYFCSSLEETEKLVSITSDELSCNARGGPLNYARKLQVYAMHSLTKGWYIVLAYFVIGTSAQGLNVSNLKQVLQAVDQAGFKPYCYVSDTLRPIVAACNESQVFTLKRENNPLWNRLHVICILDIIHAINTSRKYIIEELVEDESFSDQFLMTLGTHSKRRTQFYNNNHSNYLFNKMFFSTEFVNHERHTEETREILNKFHNLLNSHFAKYEFEMVNAEDIESIEEFIQFFLRYPQFSQMVVALRGFKEAAEIMMRRGVDELNSIALTTIQLEQIFNVWRRTIYFDTTSLNVILYQIGRLFSQYYLNGNPYGINYSQIIRELAKEMEILNIPLQ
ncbi:uncharacterized protein LOC142233586 [Haematobia irritans]|uniref:uncharacterized protein LOC142233586 n=1 Tax=Haematobia irritans TaxID=7368 RepID=UPI003F50515A